MTLMEMMVAIALSSFLLLGLASLAIYTARSFAALANYIDLDQYSRKTLDSITKEIRMADRVISYSTNQLVLTNFGSGQILSYTYTPSARTFVRTNGSNVDVLLSECDAFTFSYFQDVTKTNSFEQYAATGTNDLKVIQLSWRCSRRVINRLNTESMQSAKVVMRKV